MNRPRASLAPPLPSLRAVRSSPSDVESVYRPRDGRHLIGDARFFVPLSPALVLLRLRLAGFLTSIKKAQRRSPLCCRLAFFKCGVFRLFLMPAAAVISELGVTRHTGKKCASNSSMAPRLLLTKARAPCAVAASCRKRLTGNFFLCDRIVCPVAKSGSIREFFWSSAQFCVSLTVRVSSF